MKELFKNFNKITFPENTDYSADITDASFWHLIVDGKDCYSNIETNFLERNNVYRCARCDVNYRTWTVQSHHVMNLLYLYVQYKTH